MFANPIHDLLPDMFYTDPVLQNYLCEDFKTDTTATLVSTVLLSSRNIEPRDVTGRPGRYVKNVSFMVNATNGAAIQDNPADLCALPAFRLSHYDEIRIVSLNSGSKTDTDIVFDALERFYDERFNVERMTAVEQYFNSQRRLRSLVFHNKTTNSSLVVIERDNFAKHHLILSAFSVLLPALFKDKPLNDWERKFLTTLTYRNDVGFTEAVRNWLEDNDWRNKLLEKQLIGFASGRITTQKRTLENEIERIDSNINRTESSLSDLYKEREKKTLVLLGLATKEEDKSGEELVDFFKSNKELNLCSADGSRLVFEVKTALANYDPDAFEAYVKNKNSELYKDYNYWSFPVDDGLALMKAIFDTNDLRVMMKGKFILDFGYFDFDINRSYSPFLNNTVANPHLTDYNCPGNNRRLIMDAVRNYDYIMAVTYCISVTSNLNFAEPHNVSNFMRHLFADAKDRRCIVTKGGEDMTVKEAIEYLKKGE